MTRAHHDPKLTHDKETPLFRKGTRSRTLMTVRRLVLTGLIGSVLAVTHANAQSAPSNKDHGGNPFITLHDGTEVTYQHLLNLAGKHHKLQRELLAKTTEAEVELFNEWVAAKQHARLQEKKAREKSAQLPSRAEEYVLNVEQGKLVPDQKFIREHILDEPLVEESVKKRARKFVN